MKHINPSVLVVKKPQSAEGSTASTIESGHDQSFGVANIQNPAIELLLEAMTAQQDQMRQLTETVMNLSSTFEQEIRAIPKLLGSLLPKLQGLSPDDIERVDKMLDLFLSR